MRQKSVIVLFLCIPFFLFLGDVGFGVRKNFSLLERVANGLGQTSVSIAYRMKEPLRWIDFQRNGMRKLADLEEKYRDVVVLKQTQQERILYDACIGVNKCFVPEAEKQYVAARLVLSQVPTVYVGTEDGIREGSVVIYKGVYVGRITKAENHIASVELLSGMTHVLRVVSKATNIEGVLTNVDGQFRIEQLGWDAKMEKGDIFVTYGSEGGIPPFIPIAEVTEILSQGSDPTQTVVVMPLYTPKHGDAVLIREK